MCDTFIKSAQTAHHTSPTPTASSNTSPTAPRPCAARKNTDLSDKRISNPPIPVIRVVHTSVRKNTDPSDKRIIESTHPSDPRSSYVRAKNTDLSDKRINNPSILVIRVVHTSVRRTPIPRTNESKIRPAEQSVFFIPRQHQPLSGTPPTAPYPSIVHDANLLDSAGTHILRNGTCFVLRVQHFIVFQQKTDETIPL